jgi:acetoin utilization deacetylase AcuC-like enzyme
LFVQEGGYTVEKLGDLAGRVLQGYLAQEWLQTSVYKEYINQIKNVQSGSDLYLKLNVWLALHFKLDIIIFHL